MTRLDFAINEMIAQRGYAYSCGVLQSELRRVLEVWVDPAQKELVVDEIIGLINLVHSIHLTNIKS